MNLPPLERTWPLDQQARHFELGHVLNCALIDLIDPTEVGGLGLHHAGCWECDLSDNRLTWSGGVYDIFGLPRGIRPTRGETLGYYSEDSRSKMERLRSYSIRHRCGFALDVEIRAAIGETRWVRLIGAVDCEAGRPVRLHGIKLIV